MALCPCIQSVRFPLTRAAATKHHRRREFNALIELPQYQSIVPTQALRTHIPNFYNAVRQAGSRRIDPMNYVRPYLTTFQDVQVFECALNWIFLHVGYYQTRQCHFHHPTPIPIDQNPIEILVLRVEQFHALGNPYGAHKCLSDALEIFRVLSFFLQSDLFGSSSDIFNAYHNAALRLAPLVSSAGLGGQQIYKLVSGMASACGNNPGIVRGFVERFPLHDRHELADFCYQAVQLGDLAGYAILRLLQ